MVPDGGWHQYYRWHIMGALIQILQLILVFSSLRSGLVSKQKRKSQTWKEQIKPLQQCRRMLPKYSSASQPRAFRANTARTAPVHDAKAARSNPHELTARHVPPASWPHAIPTIFLCRVPRPDDDEPSLAQLLLPKSTCKQPTAHV